MSKPGIQVPPLLLGLGGLALVASFLVWIRPFSAPPLRSGAGAPELTLDRLEGGEFSLSETRGRVVFLNFWATWCAPCIEEAPSLDRLYRSLRNEGFLVAAVSIDGPGERATVNAFRSRFDLSFPILLDPGKRSYEAYQVTGVPETFLIDPEGRLVERFVGPRDWSRPRYADAVRRLLARPAEAGTG